MSAPTSTDLSPTGSRRDPHVLVALGSFLAMIAASVGIIIGLVSLGRFLHNAL